jgi:hypothetical protein
MSEPNDSAADQQSDTLVKRPSDVRPSEAARGRSVRDHLSRPAPEGDQARLGIFRALLVLQVLVAGLFGLLPLVLPDTFAQLTGGAQNESFVARIAGAATVGYALMALVGVFRPRWAELRIPTIATFTFNLAAVAGALITLGEGDTRPIVFFVAVAATVFTFITGYWLYRNEGGEPDGAQALEAGFRATLLLGTGAAILFGTTPLLMARLFAETMSLPTDDLFIYRMAGAATLGFGVAGIFELLAGRWIPSRVTVLGGIAFNALVVVSAAIYFAGGGTSILGGIVLLLGAFFAFTLTGWAARAQR